MKLVRYSKDGVEGFGTLSDLGVTDLSSEYQGFAEMVADVSRLKSTPKRSPSAVDSLSLLPPVDRRSKFLCMAINYYGHLKERGREPTKEPILFAKFHASLTGPYARIPFTGVSEVLDYEGELAVVIGRSARNVRRADVWDHIAGLTLVNDISARSLFLVPQGTGGGTMMDWFSCKALDHSTPVGPWIVTPDEAGEFGGLVVETFLNGERVQSGSVTDMVFDIPKIVEFASSRVTLEPGDVISTGTSAGVGAARGRTLMKGDLVRVQADGIGHLENRVV